MGGGWTCIENNVDINYCDVEAQKETDNVYITLFRGLSLHEYVVACCSDCHAKHAQPCDWCAALSPVAARIRTRTCTLCCL